MQSRIINNTEIFYTQSNDGDNKENAPVILWAHGWGQSHRSFTPLIQSLPNIGLHINFDLPGFGQSPKPQKDWDTNEYADAIALFIKEMGFKSIIWIGHSFGCRVGIRLASHHPELVSKLILIAGAGLKRKRNPFEKIKFKTKVFIYKLLRNIILSNSGKSWLRNKFSSSDDLNAGEMRGIFRKAIAEDLSKDAKKIQCKTTLIYGEKDQETPTEFGQRYHRFIQNSQLYILENQDHYTVLGQGRYIVAKLIRDFIKE